MGSSQSRDFDTSNLNSFWTVIGLSHDPIETFVGKCPPVCRLSSLGLSVARDVVSRLLVVALLVDSDPHHGLWHCLRISSAPQNTPIRTDFDISFGNNHSFDRILNNLRSGGRCSPSGQFSDVPVLCHVLGLWPDSGHSGLLVHQSFGHSLSLSVRQ